MCRSIRQLRRGDEAGAATTGEAEAAALQYVRKISGFRAPSAKNEHAFQHAVEDIAAITERLLQEIGTPIAEGPGPVRRSGTRRAIIAARRGAIAAVRRPRRAPAPGA